MFKPRPLPANHKPFASLPVRLITVGRGSEQMAVHVSGPLLDRLPVVCLAGYHRNMADWGEFVRLGAQALRDAHPFILIDFKGRGRSSNRAQMGSYSSLNDASDVIEIMRALAVDRALFVGQGYGGQVLMALAAQKPGLIAGSVLLDAGPVSDPRALVRLRETQKDLSGVRGEASLKPMLRRMVAADYPGSPDTVLEALALRTHFVDPKGRLQPLFDRHLIKLLEPFDLDDILVAQWQLFDALGSAPLMVMRTQLTQQLRRETFDEMLRRRRDAEGYIIENQGSPALLESVEDVQPIADFIRQVAGAKKAA